MGLARAYSPVLHFDDINGRPLVGGKLYTYAAGTSTPATTYRDKDGSEANTNPILLNERGECVVWLNDKRSYKFVLKDALDNTIWDADNVTIPAGEGGGSEVTITPTITTGTKIADYSIDGEAGELFTPNVTLSTLACVGGTCTINQAGQAQYDGSGSFTRWVMPHVMSVTSANISDSADLKKIALTFRMAVSNGAKQFIVIVTDDLPKFGFAKNNDNTFLIWTIYWIDGTTTTADGN